MRNFNLKEIALAMAGLLIILTPAYGASEAIGSGAGSPIKTLRDFQKEYSGTKPVVAHLKYYDYLKNTPKATLDVGHMR